MEYRGFHGRLVSFNEEITIWQEGHVKTCSVISSYQHEAQASVFDCGTTRWHFEAVNFSSTSIVVASVHSLALRACIVFAESSFNA